MLLRHPEICGGLRIDGQLNPITHLIEISSSLMKTKIIKCCVEEKGGKKIITTFHQQVVFGYILETTVSVAQDDKCFPSKSPSFSVPFPGFYC